MLKRFTFQAISNATVSVDTFFTLRYVCATTFHDPSLGKTSKVSLHRVARHVIQCLHVFPGLDPEMLSPGGH